MEEAIVFFERLKAEYKDMWDKNRTWADPYDTPERKEFIRRCEWAIEILTRSIELGNKE